jgi:hypothetical protein
MELETMTKQSKVIGDSLAEKEIEEISETAKPVAIKKENIEITETAKPVIVPTEPAKPVVSLQVFLQIAGKKWDQLAGFKQHATKNNLGPLTVPDWRKAFNDFMNRPTT